MCDSLLASVISSAAQFNSIATKVAVILGFVTNAALPGYGAIDSQAVPTKTLQLPGRDISKGNTSTLVAAQSLLAFSRAVLTSCQATGAALKEEKHTSGSDIIKYGANVQTLGEDTTAQTPICGRGLPLLKGLVSSHHSDLLNES